MDQDDLDQAQQGQDQPVHNPQFDDPVQPLPQDGDTPATGATDVDDDTPTDHPATDDGVQAEEVYDEGLGGAVEGSGTPEDNPQQGAPS